MDLARSQSRTESQTEANIDSDEESESEYFSKKKGPSSKNNSGEDTQKNSTSHCLGVTGNFKRHDETMTQT